MFQNVISSKNTLLAISKISFKHPFSESLINSLQICIQINKIWPVLIILQHVELWLIFFNFSPSDLTFYDVFYIFQNLKEGMAFSIFLLTSKYPHMAISFYIMISVGKLCECTHQIFLFHLSFAGFNNSTEAYSILNP